MLSDCNMSTEVSTDEVQQNNRIGAPKLMAALAVIACVLTMFSGCGSFSIIGTWKNNGPDNWSSTHSTTVTFTEDNCNVYSPKDAYTLTKNADGTYDLEVDGRSGGGTFLKVTVKDNDHIVLSNRATSMNLERIK